MRAHAGPRLGERVVAPFGRRPCEVTRNLESGGYRIFSALDRAGPEPAAGQFYMLATESVRHGIPCVTTMTGASAASRAIFAAARGEVEVRTLQELHRPAEHEPSKR